jgi:hypothetical protein
MTLPQLPQHSFKHERCLIFTPLITHEYIISAHFCFHIYKCTKRREYICNAAERCQQNQRRIPAPGITMPLTSKLPSNILGNSEAYLFMWQTPITMILCFPSSFLFIIVILFWSLLICELGDYRELMTASVVYWSEFLAADPVVPGSIPGVARFSE